MGVMTATGPLHRDVALAQLSSGERVAYWTAESVESRLREALDTLSKLPRLGCFPGGIKSTMPNPVQRPDDWWPQPGSPTFKQEWDHVRKRIDDERNSVRSVPTAALVTRMDEALAWQHLVEPRRYFQALAAHCLGEGATKTARRLRVSRETVRLWRRRALGQIAGSLNDALSKERGLANLAPTR